MKRLFAPFLALLMVAVPAAAVGFLAHLSTRPPEELVRPHDAVYSVVSSSYSDDSRLAGLRFRLGPSPVIVSMGRQGIVTSSNLEIGRSFSTGDVLFVVDSVQIRLLAGGVPLYRDLSAGMTGEDVRQVEGLLAGSGHLDESLVDDRFTATTAQAVRTYEKEIGATASGVFRMDYVAWAASEPFVVETPLIQVGRPNVALGGEIAKGQGDVIGAFLLEADGASLKLDAPYELLIDGDVVGVVGADGKIPDGILEVAVASYFEKKEAGEDRQGDSSEISSTGPDEGALFLPVTIRREAPLVVTNVAASAVMLNAGGDQTCVWARDGEENKAIAVTVVGGTIGISEVEGLPDGREVLVNPAQVLEDATCP